MLQILFEVPEMPKVANKRLYSTSFDSFRLFSRLRVFALSDIIGTVKDSARRGRVLFWYRNRLQFQKVNYENE